MLKRRNLHVSIICQNEKTHQKQNFPIFQSQNSSILRIDRNNDHKSQQTEEMNHFVLKTPNVVQFGSKLILKSTAESQRLPKIQRKGPFFLRRRISSIVKRTDDDKISRVVMRNYQI
jgi:hypothetical protein